MRPWTRLMMVAAVGLVLSGSGLSGSALAATPGVAADEQAFLAANAAKAGWSVLPSGLQYRIVRRASADETRRPTLDEFVMVHYRGRLIDGREFDSSYSRGEPAVFQLGKLIAGWKEGITRMRPGETWEFVIPAALAYGDRGVPKADIPPGATLHFTVELIGISKEPPPAQ